MLGTYRVVEYRLSDTGKNLGSQFDSARRRRETCSQCGTFAMFSRTPPPPWRASGDKILAGRRAPRNQHVAHIVPFWGYFRMSRTSKRIAAAAALAAPLALGLTGVASAGTASASTTASASSSQHGGDWNGGHHKCDPCDPCGGGWHGGHHHGGWGDDDSSGNGDTIGVIIG